MNTDKQTPTEYKDYGYINGRPTPPEVEDCYSMNHCVQTREVGRCARQYWCMGCMITWKVDSSD